MKYLIVIVGLLISACAPDKTPKPKSCVLLHTVEVCCKRYTIKQRDIESKLEECDDNFLEIKTVVNPVNIYQR